MITARTGKAVIPFLRKQLLRAHADLVSRKKTALREFSLALVGDRVMSDLHARFMNIAGPTDVLTFPLEQDSRGRTTGGEVIICIPEARRQAKNRGVELRMEVLLYALHGMLHLSGFDDRTERDFRTMHRTEDAILQRLGFSPVFYHRAARVTR